MDYTQLTISFESSEFPEIFEAELSEIGFDSFEAQDANLKAYIPKDNLDQSALNEILDAYKENITSHSIELIEHQNWNEMWESNYDPVIVDDKIFIGAPFHEVPEGFDQIIILEPNMSFGTGHHPTTHMMLRSMSAMNLRGKSVFDFGAGSGILCIYADQQGAEGFGVEIDEHAAEAANKNLELNDCKSFRIDAGGLERSKGHKFDLIVANINRNVIEESATTLRELTKPRGTLLCAGFLNSDVDELRAHMENSGFNYQDQLQQDEWTLLKFIAP